MGSSSLKAAEEPSQRITNICITKHKIPFTIKGIPSQREQLKTVPSRWKSFVGKMDPNFFGGFFLLVTQIGRTHQGEQDTRPKLETDRLFRSKKSTQRSQKMLGFYPRTSAGVLHHFRPIETKNLTKEVFGCRFLGFGIFSSTKANQSIASGKEMKISACLQ
ncbi:unnamed protein product [Victoria cruziana]